MIEIFRTNVKTSSQARMLIEKLHQFYKCEANFDLDDCDRILRVKCSSGNIMADDIITLLNQNGFYAEVLPENYPLPIIQSLLNSSLCQ